MRENEELMDHVAQVVEAMRKSGMEPTLIGGLAVYLRRHIATIAMDVHVPACLSRIRPTPNAGR